jgi:hypothetical protein
MAYTCFAQGWSTPVNVSNMGTHCNSPKMVVDHNGTIHAVWSSWVTQEYRKIMYSKSETHGDTWSTPIAIADDSLQWFAQPDIACDMQNHLYVAFEGDAMDPSNSVIYIVVNDGTQWGSPFVLSENFYGSMHTRLITDNTGRVYCFWDGWYMGNDKIMYRYYENQIWSNLLIPYTNAGEYYFLNNVAVDSSNNLHCVGYYLNESQNAYNLHVYYFSYIRSSNQWSPFELISDTISYSWQGSDISLNIQQIPHFVWGQFLNPYPYPSTDNATLYCYPDESGWLPVESIEVNHNSYDHQLIIDRTNQSNICVNQWTNIPNQPSDSYLINYRNINNIWIGEEIDKITPGAFYEPDLISLGNETIGVIYYKGSATDDSVSDIYFSKFNIYTKIQMHDLPATDLIITPNPFTDETELSYIINSQCHLVLDIFDLSGKLIERLIDQTQSPGRYCHTWQCTGLNRKEVKAGVYIVRLQAGRYVYSRKVVKL